ncbi:flavonol 3-O-glucosyltransferase UGT89B1-like isoform X1 [Nymphaea colorata]|nr:flavonol 3-O-glucosyltransferase UGT89B1-like isoform X1 [Nymphaea colorata]
MNKANPIGENFRNHHIGIHRIRHWQSPISTQIKLPRVLYPSQLHLPSLMATRVDRPHILVFPYPDQGHLIPLLDFAHLLAVRGLSITIVTTSTSRPLLDPLLSQNLPIEPLVLDPNAPPDLRRHPSVPRSRNQMQALLTLSDPIAEWFQAQPTPPICMVSDFFLGWTYHLSRRLGIPRIAFFPSGAFTLSIFNSLWINLPQRPLEHADDDEYLIQLTDVPNCPTLPWYHLLANYRRYRKSDPGSEFVRDSFLANICSWGSVFNSFEALEGIYLNHLRQFGKVWAVGPILPPMDNDRAVVERGGSSSIPAARIVEWLDSKSDHSVVYVCFGSQAVLSDHEVDELGAGLEASGVNFLWCIRNAQSWPRLAALESRVQDRGLLVKGWAPQVLILKHRSVGAFFTHCGWNSTMEGLVAGVPLLACPRGADQFLTTRLLVDELGVAVRVAEHGGGVPKREEVALALVKVIHGGHERARAEEVQKLALGAGQEGGSSFKDFNMFMEELHILHSSKKSSSATQKD